MLFSLLSLAFSTAVECFSSSNNLHAKTADEEVRLPLENLESDEFPLMDSDSPFSLALFTRPSSIRAPSVTLAYLSTF
jgi:hypothetical protein